MSAQRVLMYLGAVSIGAVACAIAVRANMAWGDAVPSLQYWPFGFMVTLVLWMAVLRVIDGKPEPQSEDAQRPGIPPEVPTLQIALWANAVRLAEADYRLSDLPCHETVSSLFQLANWLESIEGVQQAQTDLETAVRSEP